jgi:hypothetical protein
VVGSVRHYPLELILLRQFAARLTTPVALFDMDGWLIYLNPAAEAVFGVDFADLGELSLEQALAIAQPKDVHGAPMTPDTVPVGIALGQGRPEARTVSIRDPRGRLHRLGTTTIPVQSYGGAFVGVMSIFWKLEDVGRVASAGADPTPSRESGPTGFPVGARNSRRGGRRGPPAGPTTDPRQGALRRLASGCRNMKDSPKSKSDASKSSVWKRLRGRGSTVARW